MSIEGKHSYRFGYLKSEEWQNVRIAALAREKGQCQICGQESIYNDAHHVWYPKNIYQTTIKHLVILCRPCHDLLHSLRPSCKTNVEAIGRNEWAMFSATMKKWRTEKLHFIYHGDEPKTNAKDLRDAYEKLRKKTQYQEQIILSMSKTLSGVRDLVVFSGVDTSDFVI